MKENHKKHFFSCFHPLQIQSVWESLDVDVKMGEKRREKVINLEKFLEKGLKTFVDLAWRQV